MKIPEAGRVSRVVKVMLGKRTALHKAHAQKKKGNNNNNAHDKLDNFLIHNSAPILAKL